MAQKHGTVIHSEYANTNMSEVICTDVEAHLQRNGTNEPICREMPAIFRTKESDDAIESGPEIESSEKSASVEARMTQNPISGVCLRAFFDTCLATLLYLSSTLDTIAADTNIQPISTYGKGAMEAACLGPTVFSIAFAAIIARFYKHMTR